MLEKGKKYKIHSYKHDGQIHRSWDEAVFLGEKDECFIFGNNKTIVIEADGRTWKTKEPAIMFFYKEHWFNIIGQLKANGIYYYCNIASPFVIEEEIIKYIDYDLDLRVFPDDTYKVLDKGEYKYHKRIMNYSDELDSILNLELKELINKLLIKDLPFNVETINNYYKKYEFYTKKITN